MPDLARRAAASAARAGWARALINGKVEAYADHLKATQATALGRITLTRTTSAQRAFALRGVETTLNGITRHNELSYHISLRQALTGTTLSTTSFCTTQGYESLERNHVAQRAFIPRAIRSFVAAQRSCA